MTIEIHGDERDWEPDGFYYDDPCYMPEEDGNGDYDREDRDAYAGERNDANEHETPRQLKPLQMRHVTKVRRYIDDEF